MSRERSSAVDDAAKTKHLAPLLAICCVIGSILVAHVNGRLKLPLNGASKDLPDTILEPVCVRKADGARVPLADAGIQECLVLVQAPLPASSSAVEYCHKMRRDGWDGSGKSNIGGWQSAPHPSLPTEKAGLPFPEDFVKAINLSIRAGLNHEGGSARTPRISRMWCNINSEGNYNKVHTHKGVGQTFDPAAVFSGVAYIAVPPTGVASFFWVPPSATDPAVARAIKLTPSLGNVLLFDATLPHGTDLQPPTRDGASRVSVAFNVAFD